MTELDRVGKSDNFNSGGFQSARSSRRQREKKKRWNVCMVMVLLYIYSKILGVRLPVCPVIKNKVLMFAALSV